MNLQYSNLNYHLPQRDYWRISDLATTAERKTRTYTTAKGITRTIKGRPANIGYLPIGESTIWEKVRRGEFPKPIKISPRITVWKRSDIIKWLESKQ